MSGQYESYFHIAKQYVLWYSDLKGCYFEKPIFVLSDLMWHIYMLATILYFFQLHCPVTSFCTCLIAGLGYIKRWAWLLIQCFAMLYPEIDGFFLPSLLQKYKFSLLSKSLPLYVRMGVGRETKFIYYQQFSYSITYSYKLSPR